MAGALPENAAAARRQLADGRPALVWRRLVADTETPVGAALKLIERGRGDFLLESVEGIGLALIVPLLLHSLRHRSKRHRR